jgi:hypothetical protein
MRRHAPLDTLYCSLVRERHAIAQSLQRLAIVVGGPFRSCSPSLFIRLLAPVGVCERNLGIKMLAQRLANGDHVARLPNSRH